MIFKLGSKTPLISADEYDNIRGSLLATVELAENYLIKDQMLADKLLAAKTDYIKLTGKLHESEENYVHRVKSYLYWFLIDWRLSPSNTAPLERIKKQLADIEQAKLVDCLMDCQHSLFMIDKFFKNGVRLLDLFSGKKYDLADRQSFDGLSSGEWFETRLFKYEDQMIFSDYFIIHPQAMLKPVLKHLKKTKPEASQFKKFIFRLQSFYVKWKYYKMIDLSAIYSIETK